MRRRLKGQTTVGFKTPEIEVVVPLEESPDTDHPVTHNTPWVSYLRRRELLPIQGIPRWYRQTIMVRIPNVFDIWKGMQYFRSGTWINLRGGLCSV